MTPTFDIKGETVDHEMGARGLNHTTPQLVTSKKGANHVEASSYDYCRRRHDRGVRGGGTGGASTLVPRSAAGHHQASEPRSNKAVTARLPRRSNKAAAAHDRRFRQPQAGGSAVVRFRVHPAVVLADGLRDPLGGADDVRDVPDGERAGDAGAGERVLLRPVGVPEQLERERRPDAPVPLPGHPRRREPDAAQAR
jgi:hypothetical protein